MRKPFLKVWICAVVCMLLPLQAFATICWTDPVLGNQYSVELGSSREGKIALYGYVKVAQDTSPCKGLRNRIAPLSGTAVVVDSDTAVIGWLIMSIDLDHGCFGFRERLNFDQHTGTLTGEYVLETDPADPSAIDLDIVKGVSQLELSACPKPDDDSRSNEGNHNPFKHFDK